MDRAACTEIGHGPFYPDGGSSSDITAQYRKAIEICHRCPVTQQCLEYAIEIDDRYGVYGGTTPAQRARMRKGRTA